MGFYLVQLLTGLASASSLFLVAAGLTLVFGVSRIVNFAHGALYMLGAYLAWALVSALPHGPLGFWGGVLAAAAAVGLFGALVEVMVLRRTYRAPELFQLAATFGLALVIEDLVLMVFGPRDRLGPPAPGLGGAVRVLGEPVPFYDLFLVAAGPAVLLLLWLLATRTRFGILVRAASEDRETAAALGVDERRLFTAVYALGAALAGLGGALQLPRETIHHGMDVEIIAEAFVVTVVGGMGSIPGAFVAAVVIRVLQALGILWLPRIALFLTFLVLALVLVVRPFGLFGEREGPPRPDPRLLVPYRPLPPAGRAAVALLVLALALLPRLLDPYTLVVATDVLIFALFAAALHFAMGPGGLVSFGHAAYFGGGAYLAALLVRDLGLSMLPALAAGALGAGVLAVVFGSFTARLAGVYFAMLTLAFAQLLWAAATQFTELTGGHDGILGIWPPAWAATPESFYLFTLALAVPSLAVLRHLVFTPFGQALRGARDHPVRLLTLGLAPQRLLWVAFALSGFFSGLAGALHAFAKGSVFPDLLAIPASVDALVAVLLGGLQTLAGPIPGAALLVGIEAWTAAVPWPRLVLGGLVLAVAVAFPAGIVGGLAGLVRRLRFGREAPA
ncbi:High-affinity branched-chain amino acid transport system permease protein LivH [bacterium HR39]|nr:High-affinity branched-chain amino acid transport system permease protein LivH [bacterium HR39]